jgi:hypothetical protein
MFAIVVNRGVARYVHEVPFTHAGIKHFRSLTPEQQRARGVYPVQDLTPAFDHETHKVAGMESVTVFDTHVAVVRKVVPREITPEETARKQAQTENDADLATLKGNNVLMNFLSMTPAQIDAWVAANVTNLAEARNALALLAKIVNLGLRRVTRE